MQFRPKDQAQPAVKLLLAAWNSCDSKRANSFKQSQTIDSTSFENTLGQYISMVQYACSDTQYGLCMEAQERQKKFCADRLNASKEKSATAAAIASVAAAAADVACDKQIMVTAVPLSLSLNPRALLGEAVGTPSLTTTTTTSSSSSSSSCGSGQMTISPMGMTMPAKQHDLVDMELIAHLVSDEGKPAFDDLTEFAGMIVPKNAKQQQLKRGIDHMLSSCQFFFKQQERQKKQKQVADSQKAGATTTIPLRFAVEVSLSTTTSPMAQPAVAIDPATACSPRLR